MKIPDNFEALDKLFKDSEEDAPTDFAEFLGEPIQKMVLRLGNAIQRLAKCQKLIESGQYEEGKLDPLFNDIFGSCQKYISVLRSRRDEFVAFVQKIDTGGMPEYLIMESLTSVCAAITHMIQGDDEDDDDDDFDPYENLPSPEEEEPVFYCKKCAYIRFSAQVTDDLKCKKCGEEVVPGDDDFDYEKDGPKS